MAVKYVWVLAAFALICMATLISYVANVFPTDFQLKDYVFSQMERIEQIHRAVLFATATLLSAIGLPRQIIALCAGHLLGGLSGALTATAIALSACSIDFTIGRTLLRPPLQKRYPQAIEKLDTLLSTAPFYSALALRLFPSGSNLLTSLLGGASKVPARYFLAGTAIGYLPQMIVFSFLGSGAAWATKQQGLLSGVSLGVAVGIGALLWWRYTRR